MIYLFSAINNCYYTTNTTAAWPSQIDNNPGYHQAYAAFDRGYSQAPYIDHKLLIPIDIFDRIILFSLLNIFFAGITIISQEE